MHDVPDCNFNSFLVGFHSYFKITKELHCNYLLIFVEFWIMCLMHEDWSLWDIMPCSLVVIDHFCSALIFWVKQWKSSLLLDCLTLQMKALCSFEIAVSVFRATWHNVPEDLNLQQHMCDDLISCISYLCTCWKLFCFYFNVFVNSNWKLVNDCEWPSNWLFRKAISLNGETGPIHTCLVYWVCKY